MSELDRIRVQITRSVEAEAWHGPSLMEVLSGIGARAASARPLPGAHTIWEILLHVTSSTELVLSRLEGEARDLSAEEDWPSPPAAGDEEAWKAAVAALGSVHGKVIEKLSGLSESRLDLPILPGYSSVYVTLHGLVQHNLYHAGQMAILKKAV
jgi:uncharacterized damage-inducible protein DinB